MYFKTSKDKKPQALGTQSLLLAISIVPANWTMKFLLSEEFPSATSLTVGLGLLGVQLAFLGAIAAVAVVQGVKELKGRGNEVAPQRGRALAGIIIACVVYLLILGVSAVGVVVQLS